MNWPVVDKCCCCLSLRAGAFVIGGLNAASAIILLTFIIISFKAYEAECHETAFVITQKLNDTVIEEVDLTRFNVDAFGVNIVFFGLRLMLSAVLIVGAQKSNLACLNIYHFYQVAQVYILGIWLLFEISGSPVTFIFFRPTDFLLQIYVFVVIRSLIMQVQTTQIPQCGETNLKTSTDTEAN